MIPQNNSNFNSDSSNFNSNRHNPWKKGTDSKTSPTPTSRNKLLELLQRKADYLEVDSTELKKDSKYQTGYIQGIERALRALGQESNPYERPERYNEQADGWYEVRLDWIRCSGKMGKDEIKFKRLKTFLRKHCGMVFVDSHKKSPYYNHSLEDLRTGTTLMYSRETDSEGNRNNKGKYTLSIPGKYFQSSSFYTQLELLRVLMREFKVNVKRLDPRLSDNSKFVTPRQIYDWCRQHEEHYGRPPIKGIKKDKQGVWNYGFRATGGKGDDTFTIGKNPRRLSVYDERYKHNIDAIAWELRLEEEIAHKHAEDLVFEYEGAIGYCDSKAREILSTLKDQVHAETKHKMIEECIDNSYYRDIYMDIYADMKRKIYEGCIEEYMYSIMVNMITSAFVFYEYIDKNEEHISERCEVASWWHELKEKFGQTHHIRHTKTKTYTTLDSNRAWRDGNWNNATILLGAAKAGINSKQLQEIHAQDEKAATDIVLNNLMEEYRPIVSEKIKKFHKTMQAKLLDSYIATAA